MKTNRSIVFDEIGYCSAPGNHLNPAGQGCSGPATSNDEQSNLVQALLQQVYPQSEPHMTPSISLCCIMNLYYLDGLHTE